MQRAEANETSCPERMRRVWGAVPRILLVRRRRSCSCRRASLRRPTAEFAPAALPFPEGHKDVPSPGQSRASGLSTQGYRELAPFPRFRRTLKGHPGS